MPFTTYHLASGFLVGLPLRRRVHLPTLLVATTIPVDLGSVLLVLGGIDARPHGLTHGFVVAALLGVLTAIVVYVLDRYLKVHKTLYRAFYLAQGDEEFHKYIAGGVIGALLHVVLDAPLYEDMSPFEPFVSGVNPFLLSGTQLTLPLYDLVLYAGLLAYLVFFYEMSRRALGGPVARLQLGVLVILVAILLAPTTVDVELLFGEPEAFIPLGVGVLGVVLAVLSLVEMRLMSTVRAGLVLSVTATLLATAYADLGGLLLSSTAATLVYTGVAAIIVLLRSPLTRIRITFMNKSLKAVDLLLMGWLSALLIVGVPVFVAALFTILVESRRLAGLEPLARPR
ncbi:hypothetical protein TCELL_0124 [Thermogladius calderae 1633]|uniref:DUF4184 family protein n=1 Tax=Thermogladius calderae (strain DSM 22663 / VKM B-2946 / 1633) TaxID=1184251 RepID=I3TCR1_THEC1|nr:hypothetical protein [Thermogladius calderae]AFK50549.1 hypothetical protein TCELL_0124 [Thermogladius calderae 1633]